MTSRLAWIPLLLAAAALAHADWRDNAGYSALQAELGASMPTGAGIALLQSEANSGGYLPQATAGTVPFSGTGDFTGKTFTPYSGAGAASGHAASVASVFYSNSASLSPGVTDIHCYLADDFATLLYNGITPPVFPGSVQNHSWVGSFGDTDIDVTLLRRLDFIIDRDDVTIITPLNNGGYMYALLGNAYHSLTVGLLSGNHPQSGSNTDGSGRMKPDLVVDQGFTSFAGPAVGSAAALLLDAIRPAYLAADDPRVVKALLLAGASKSNIPAWHRADTTKPYHAVWGAGELNVLNAHHILTAGQGAPSGSTEVGLRGWDARDSSTATPRRYYFTIPQGAWAGTFSAALTWHRSLSAPFDTSSLVNLNLKLYASSGFDLLGSPIDQSISTVDNVEHLFQRNLPPGQYALEVTTDTDAVSYAIAWEAQTTLTGPTLAIRRGTGGEVLLDLAQLDPFLTYTIEASPGLSPSDWQPAATLRTADTTASTTATWQEPQAPLPQAKFYRLGWTSPR